MNYGLDNLFLQQKAGPFNKRGYVILQSSNCLQGTPGYNKLYIYIYTYDNYNEKHKFKNEI